MRVEIPLFNKIEISAPQFIVLIYAITTCISAFLLSLPWATKPGVDLSFTDIMFTTVSAITVTGLTVTNTADSFTPFGIGVIAASLQAGGIGIMTLWTFVWVVLGKNIGLGYRQLIMIDQNRNQLMGLVKVIQLVFGFAIIIQLLGIAYFASIFYARGYYPDVGQALYYAGFHSITSYTNGGFDIFGDSLIGFQNDYLVQSGSMVLIVLGAIGFPVLIEILSYFHAKTNNVKFRFSLYTKVTLFIFFLLLIIGVIGVLVIEQNGIMDDRSWHDQLFVAMFLSVTARSGGLTTIDITTLFVPSLLFVSILMFIGASPSSVGGGIRTTTFATVILAVRSYSLGRRNVQIFGKRLDEEDIMKSFVVFTTGTFLIISSILVINILETSDHSLVSIIFEVTSAFGTCGLSTGIIPDFTNLSKYILMSLMFIGRIGILAFLVSVHHDKKQANFKYPVERIIIG